MGYELRVRSADGTAHLATVPVSDIDDPEHDATFGGETIGLGLLSGYTPAGFKVKRTSRYVADLSILKRQIQIVKDGTVIWWGRLIKRSIDGGFWRYQCYSRLWDLYRRHYGPVAANLLTNPSFENGLTGWTTVNCSADTSDDWHQLGDYCARVAASTYDERAFIQQVVPVTTFPTLGIAYTFAAHYQLDSAGWLGSAEEDWGIVLARSDDGGATLNEDFLEVHTITEETPKDEPLRGEVELLIPAATSTHLVARLMAQGYDPGGHTRYDATSLTIPESVSTAIRGSDVYDLIGASLIHAQDKGWLGLGLAGSATGEQVIRSFQFFEGANIGESITDFSRDGVCDVDITWNGAGTEAYLHIYPDGKGTLRTDLEFTDGNNGSVAQILEWDEDGEEVSNSPRFYGSGDGSDREYGIYTDASELDGLVLESVHSAPPEARIDSLFALALQEWARAHLPVVKGRLLCRYSDFGSLTVGDTVPSTLNSVGWSGSLRVYSIDLNPQSGMVEVGVNRAA